MSLLRLALLAAAAWLVVGYVRALRHRMRVTAGRTGNRVPADPWAVLGVPRGASREEITRAYHEQMRSYHPDRVADLGEELRRVAHEKTIEIQQAYAELTRRG